VDYPAQRRTQLARFLVEDGADAFLVTNPINVTYLTGFSGESSYLILQKERVLLVSDGRFTQQLTEECPGLDTYIRPSAQNLYQAAGQVLNKLGFRSLAFESSHLTVAEWEMLRAETRSIDWKPTRDRVENLRVIKDPSEIAQIREAIEIAERAYNAFRALLRPEDTEKVLCDALESYVRRFGGTESSFPSIVAVGPRSALPHAPPTQNTVGGSDLLLIDWGASGRFYKSDLTRVLVRRTQGSSVSGPEKDRLAQIQTIYGTVLQAQEKAIQAVRPGVQGQAVDGVARGVISEAGYGDFFGHGLGHGLGMQVHEAPAVRPNSQTVLQPGMVITIEPGIYLPDWGGVRIEDDVLVTSDGCEVLTTVAKDWQSALCEW
jgi:Xaa-Pro aminopeptidase